MPSSTASRSRALTTSAPARWPSMTGTPRAVAQRPLPSVMMATYLGVMGRRNPRTKFALKPTKSARSNLHDLRLFALEMGIQVGDLGVRDLMHVCRGATLPVRACADAV